MCLAESTSLAADAANPVVEPASTSQPAPCKPMTGRVMHWIRRLHLYLGLFLFPWAVLYGVTAFLFNHPAAFSDVSTTSFGPETTSGTTLEPLPDPAALAADVIAQLNVRQKPTMPYQLANPTAAWFTRDLAFATVKTDDQSISVLVDLVNGGGTIRGSAERPKLEKAPFATGAGGGPEPRRSDGPVGRAAGSALQLENPLHERIKLAVPVVLERSGFPAGEVTITSMPELRFLVEADGKIWTATCNLQSGTVTGKPGSDASEPVSTRRFLLRLHTAHGYPGGLNARWLWAVVVDVMAGVMVFWGLSGLLMWWQIKATRSLGFLLLALSAVVATGLIFGMHALMTQ